MRTLLLTPGPLTTTERTRAAMSRDWGSRDGDFIATSERVRARLLPLAGAAPGTHALIPLQGSGTFAVEAALQTFVPRDGRLLVLANGAYGHRIAEIARLIGRDAVLHAWPEDQPVDPATVAALLAADPAVTDVAVVHGETTSGLVNDIAAIAAAAAGRRLIVDAIGSLGAVPIPAGLPYAVLLGSANKGLESVPGLAFAAARLDALAAARGHAASLVLDLEAQWRGFTANRQWRFTPPTHVVAALDAALDQLDEEGGIAARHARYRRNCRVLVEGMRGLGFTPFLPDALQGPVIATFRTAPGFPFQAMYDHLHARGVVIYPGKLTDAPSFRIGCIGDVHEADMRRALHEVAGWLATQEGQSAAD